MVELLTFASEGDNTGDAIRMVAFVDQWLKVVPKVNGRPALKVPISWDNMFGNQAPNQIYWSQNSNEWTKFETLYTSTTQL